MSYTSISSLNDATPTEMRRKSTIMVTDNFRFFTDTWELEEPIGQPGAFGIAYVCHRKDQPHAKFVVKQISKARFYHIARQQRESILQNMSNEIKLQKTLNHPNICLLYDVYEDRNYIHLVMDYLEGGELFDRICEEDGFSEQKAAKIAKQILSAIEFMHSKNICHLDLKPDNILFEDMSDKSPIKVIDFGMAQVVPRLKKLKQLVGTPYYTAPEVLSGKYDRAADIWSIGIMIFCMLFGYPPFYVDKDEIKMGESEEDAIYSAVKAGFTPEVKEGYGAWFPKDIPISAEARDLISKMLNFKIQNRLTASEALDHPWIRGQAHSHQLPRTVFSSLVNFNRTNRFKLLISRLFAQKMEPERYAETVEVFRKWDKDGDGEITLEEFRAGMKEATTMSEKEIDTIFGHLDADDSRTITIEELVVSSAFDALVSVDERMFDAFTDLDKDGNGELEIDEIRKALSQLKAKDLGRAESLLAEIDTDSNGAIDYEEFLRALHPTLNEPAAEDMNRLRSKGFGSMDQQMFNKFVTSKRKQQLIDFHFDHHKMRSSFVADAESGVFGAFVSNSLSNDTIIPVKSLAGSPTSMPTLLEDEEDDQSIDRKATAVFDGTINDGDDSDNSSDAGDAGDAVDNDEKKDENKQFIESTPRTDIINRNNSDGTIVGDLMNGPESQSDFDNNNNSNDHINADSKKKSNMSIKKQRTDSHSTSQANAKKKQSDDMSGFESSQKPPKTQCCALL